MIYHELEEVEAMPRIVKNPDERRREILGTWFGSVSWRRIGLTSCVAIARKD